MYKSIVIIPIILNIWIYIVGGKILFNHQPVSGALSY